jgi:hypothetical protein
MGDHRRATDREAGIIFGLGLIVWIPVVGIAVPRCRGDDAHSAIQTPPRSHTRELRVGGLAPPPDLLSACRGRGGQPPVVERPVEHPLAWESEIDHFEPGVASGDDGRVEVGRSAQRDDLDERLGRHRIPIGPAQTAPKARPLADSVPVSHSSGVPVTEQAILNRLNRPSRRPTAQSEMGDSTDTARRLTEQDFVGPQYRRRE